MNFKVMTYNIGIIKKCIGDVLSNSDQEIIWLKHKYKDRFFADPFLIKQDSDHYYILCEEYPFKTEKGVISLLTVDKKSFSLINKKVVIEEPFHLSFPFCEENGSFIIPESVVANETYIYSFDLEKMEVTKKEKLLDVGLIDGVYYENYLFASRKTNPKLDLYAYQKIDGKYQECNDGKPILTSLKHSRSAGRMFTYDGELYRPTQDCVERYGKRIQITKINSINKGILEFVSIGSLESTKCPPYNETMHTFNVYDGFVIVDGSKDFVRFPMKIVYKLHKKLLAKK